jgi:micrococcal nuclease
LFALAAPATVAGWSGPVVNVHGGDTMTILLDRLQIKVRLDGIDAPESGQAFGKRLRQSLADLCAAKLLDCPSPLL